METLLYLGKVTLTSGILFLYYRIFLKDKTFHHYNRFYLLSAILVSLLLPLLKISYFTIELTPDFYKIINQLDTQNLKTTNHDNTYFKIFIIAFGLVAVFLLGKLVFGLLKIQRFKKNFPKEQFEGINFYQTNLSNAPFSYFKNLFWKDSIILQSDLGKQILKHEMVHIEQKHSFDKIFVEIITSIFWFNPFFYLIKKEIHLIHEYLADKKAVKQSDTKAFAQMLLASHFSGNSLPATSPFLSSNLKKRLNMLKKSKTKYSYARRIFALPLLFILAFVYLVNAKNKEIKATNTEISKMITNTEISKIQTLNVSNDTIKPKANSEEAQILSDVLAIEDENKISELGKTLKEKTTELKTLSPDSEAFDKKIDEIINLSEKMTDLANTNNYTIDTNQYWDQENMQKILGDIQQQFNSKEFKEQMSKSKDFFNSKEWKDQMKSLENLQYFEMPEIPEVPDVPKVPRVPRVPKVPSVLYGEDGTQIYFNSPDQFISKNEFKKKLSAEEAKKWEKLEKERAALAKKQAQLVKKQAELAREQAKINAQKQRTIIINKSKTPNAYYFNSNDMKNSSIDSDTKIYINGKISTREELDQLKSEDIEKMNVNKNDNNGVKKTEIRVTTKK